MADQTPYQPSAALTAALDLVSYVCQHDLAMVVRDPDTALVRLGAQAAGISPEAALAVYRTMVDAQR